MKKDTGRLGNSQPNIQNIPIRTEEGAKIKEAMFGIARGRMSMGPHPLFSQQIPKIGPRSLDLAKRIGFTVAPRETWVEYLTHWFMWLEDLRESGRINMWAAPMAMVKVGVEEETARMVFGLWQDTYEEFMEQGTVAQVEKAMSL